MESAYSLILTMVFPALKDSVQEQVLCSYQVCDLADDGLNHSGDAEVKLREQIWSDNKNFC